jgi:hypothetical protein
MSATTGAIRVEMAPKVKVWQVLLFAVAIAVSLTLGMIIGRATTTETAPVRPASTATFDLTDLPQGLGGSHAIPQPVPAGDAGDLGTGYAGPPRVR